MVLGLGVGTTALAIIIGIVLTLIIQPGSFVDQEIVRETVGTRPSSRRTPRAHPNLAEISEKLMALLPANALGSMVENDMLRVVIFAVGDGVLITMPPKQSHPPAGFVGFAGGSLHGRGTLGHVARTDCRVRPVGPEDLQDRPWRSSGDGGLCRATVLSGLLLAFSTSSSAAMMPLSIKVWRRFSWPRCSAWISAWPTWR